MSTKPNEHVFLFTDIVGSTERYERFGDVMRAAQARHDAIVESSASAHGGVVFKRVGDQCCVWFRTVLDATRAAVLSQRRLHEEDWKRFAADFEPLAVRMGVHSGEAVHARGDYFGVGLSQSARLVSAAHGGQVLLSPAARDRLHDEQGDAPLLREWGPIRLRDFRGRVSVYQVMAPGMPDVNRPPIATVGAHLIDVVEIVDGEQRGTGGVTLSVALDRLRRVIRSPGEYSRIDRSDLRRVARHPPADLGAYLLSRIAAGLDPRLDLDERFVELSLILDRGGRAGVGRWQITDQRFGRMQDALDALDEPVAVLLGAPGSGKTTVLRRLELDLAIGSLRGETSSIPFFVSLSMHGGFIRSDQRPAPVEWLREQWGRRYPSLPTIEELMANQRVLLLLDGLNEIPHADELDYRQRVLEWRAALHEITRFYPRSRVLVSCRNLDYSAPLSSPVQRVPQLRLLPMNSAQIQAFLKAHLPAHAEDVWREMRGAPWLDVVRIPFFLQLLVEQVQRAGSLPSGRVDLLIRFIYEAIVREVDNANPLVTDGRLLRARDLRRLSTSSAGSPKQALKMEGPLIDALSRIAWRMQRSGPGQAPAQVRLAVEDTLEATDLPPELARGTIGLGEDLGLLSDDPAMGDVSFTHQLFQEFFAAVRLLEHRDPTLAARPWRARDIEPTVLEVLADLEPGESLPPLPTTRWEETFLMAAALEDSPDEFIRDLSEHNLPLAGQSAAQASVTVGPELQTALGSRLFDRTRDRRADLRARMEAASALAKLGHPKLVASDGPAGGYIEPDWMAFDAGRYPIGENVAPGSGPRDLAGSPRHEVNLAEYALAVYPVTNAEWQHFIDAGGYENPEWWPTADAKAWRNGEGTATAARERDRLWRQRFDEDRDLLHRMFSDGVVPRATYQTWNRLMALSDVEFEAELVRLYPGGRLTEPEYWQMPRHSAPLQPVVGVSWFEALAYTRWMSANVGYDVQLPSEAEWEAAARGTEGNRYAWGDAFDPMRLNMAETHIGHASPIGVFPGGDTPTGLTDMCGNVMEWTRSLFGPHMDSPSPRYAYPYDPADGREDLEADRSIRRVMRGGCWTNDRNQVRASFRASDLPGVRGNVLGFRLARRP